MSNTYCAMFFVTILIRQVPLLEQELLTLMGHLSSLPVLVVSVLLGFAMCSVVELVVCLFLFILLAIVLSVSSLIYGFWWPLLVSSNSSYHRRYIPVVTSI